MQLGHGKLHWFKDVYYIKGQFYCDNIRNDCEVNSAFNSVIFIKQNAQWNGPEIGWTPRKYDVDLSTLETIDSVFLHQRHTISGYSHIIGDECFPMFYFIKKHDIKIDGVLSIPNYHRRFNSNLSFEEYLNTLTPFNFIDPTKNYFIRNVYCGWQTNTWTARDFNFDPHCYAEALCEHLSIDNAADPQDIIFVHRGEDPRRKILNLSEIQNEFKKYNIKFIDFAKLSIKEQIQTCRNTKLMIAQHGAGMINLMFLPKGSTVVEILPESLKDYDGYRQTAKMCNINYKAYIEEESNTFASKTASNSPEAQKRDRDLIININKFKDEFIL